MLNWLKRTFAKGQGMGQAAGGQAAAAERRRGNEFLDQGRLEEAAQCYRAAIALEPDAPSLANLGYVLGELGRHEQARQALEQALVLDTGQFDATYMLGSMALERGDFAQAALRLARALELQPGSEMVLRGLCSAFFLGGDIARARQTAEAALAGHPMVADFHFFLGNILSRERAFEQALGSFDKALQLQPAHPEALHNKGLALQSLGRLGPAAQSFRQAIALRPAYPQALCNLAGVLTEQGRLPEAIELSEAALAIDPHDADAHNSLGNALQAQGRLDAAVQSYRKAIGLRGDHAEAHGNLGLALLAQGRLDEAAQSLDRALAIRPAYVQGYNNLGNVRQKQNRLQEAVAAYRQALALDPASYQAHSNLAAALQAQGLHGQAIESWRAALALKPDYFDAWSNMLYGLSFSTECPPAQYLEEARSFGRAAAALARPFAARPPDAAAGRGKPLRVGFVSGDLQEHPVGFFLESVLAHLAPSRVELLAYPTGTREDRLTARIKPRFAAWHPIVGLNDADAAARIQADGVHILVDLAGHTGNNRMPLFAWRPAPVQLSWLGYFASTGVPGIDFLLADAMGVPEGIRNQFSEQVRYLPDTRLCFTAPAPADALLPGPLPALGNGFITFGCFQNMTKLNERVLALWSKVFEALPSSRLRLQGKQLSDPLVCEQLLLRLARSGIARERVTLAGPTSRDAYLRAHNEVDIMLDTFPYGGGTTTCESLWMGVPTITLAGNTLLARQGASLLACAGLPDWIADDEAGYAARLLTHCADLPRLAELRAGLRSRVLASPLFDAPRFAANLQDALEGLWREMSEREPAIP